MLNTRKVVIVGTGFVGSSIAFALMQQGIDSEMVLIDYNKDTAEGEAMDLTDGLPYAPAMKIWAGDYSDCADAALIIITAERGAETGRDPA